MERRDRAKLTIARNAAQGIARGASDFPVDFPRAPLSCENSSDSAVLPPIPEIPCKFPAQRRRGMAKPGKFAGIPPADKKFPAEFPVPGNRGRGSAPAPAVSP
jgi:hypothetical protein